MLFGFVILCMSRGGVVFDLCCVFFCMLCFCVFFCVFVFLCFLVLCFFVYFCFCVFWFCDFVFLCMSRGGKGRVVLGKFEQANGSVGRVWPKFIFGRIHENSEGWET